MTDINVKRNETVDVLRGLAILLVVLGHTLTGCTYNAEHSFIFNIIWALQMPLFILISGYVTKYNKPISSIDDLVMFIKRRTVSYLVPWIVWTLGIRGLVFGKIGFLNLKWIIYHMDSGYWFLFTIWVINLIYGCTDYCLRKFNKKDFLSISMFTLLYVCFSIPVWICGLIFGMSFLGTKLTLYYIPFYYFGFLFGRLQEYLESRKRFVDITIAIATIIFFSIISRLYLYDLDESISNLLVRILASLSGCVSISGLVRTLLKNDYRSVYRKLAYCGIHSIEIYLIHYILLTLINVDSASMIEIFITVILNYVITIGLSIMMIMLIYQNYLLGMVLFGKRKKECIFE